MCVVKFGGSSLKRLGYTGLLERLLADFRGKKILCVLSAEKGVTDSLIDHFTKLRKKIRDDTPSGLHPVEGELYQSTLLEYDNWIAHGEVRSIILASIAAKSRGLRAVPLAGWQAGILTTGNHKNASILNIDVNRIMQFVDNNDIVFIAGFQGSDLSQFVTTLGRGASDLTAIALASALDLAEVFIYTDVDGLFTADPRKLDPERLKLLPYVSYEECLELAAFGGKVIHDRAVALAQKYSTDIRIVNSDVGLKGPSTVVTSFYRMPKRFARAQIVGISSRDDVNLYSLKLPNKPGSTRSLLRSLLGANIRPDHIFQGLSQDTSIVSFVVHQNFEDCNLVLADLQSRQPIAI